MYVCTSSEAQSVWRPVCMCVLAAKHRLWRPVCMCVLVAKRRPMCMCVLVAKHRLCRGWCVRCVESPAAGAGVPQGQPVHGVRTARRAGVPGLSAGWAA